MPRSRAREYGLTPLSGLSKARTAPCGTGPRRTANAMVEARAAYDARQGTRTDGAGQPPPEPADAAGRTPRRLRADLKTLGLQAGTRARACGATTCPGPSSRPRRTDPGPVRGCGPERHSAGLKPMAGRDRCSWSPNCGDQSRLRPAAWRPSAPTALSPSAAAHPRRAAQRNPCRPAPP